MRTVYLRNGTAAYLHEELPGGRYLVEPIYLYDDFAGENVSEGGTGEVQIVTEIYNKAPVELIDAEYKMASENVKELNEEISRLMTERWKLDKQVEEFKSTLDKWCAAERIDALHDSLLTEAQIQAKRERKAQQVAIDIAKYENIVKQAQDAIWELKGESVITN